MAARQLPLALPFRAALGQEDFLVAPCNEAAVAWLDRWPDWPGPALCIHGAPGCGKTHLAQVWRVRSGAVLAGPAELAPDRVAALAAAGCVALDGADRGADEVALLHLYNLLRECGGHLLLTAERPPARWGLRLPDLRSRLLAAPAVAVDPPDDALFAALLVKLFADRQLAVREDVLSYLLRRLERSFDAARRAVAALDADALAEGQAVTVPLARRVLERL